MNIVVAPDSFKGSLTSVEASQAMKAAILSSNKDYNVVVKPMADGGEGTLESFLAAATGEEIIVKCTGPLGNTVNTRYAIMDNKTAIIELASIAGLTQVPYESRNPDTTTSYGIGEVIIDALDQGCTSIIIGIGGSATNDGGLGMLLALGMDAWDQDGNKLGPYGKDLLHLQSISLKKLDSRLRNVHIKVACDVDNPLCGERGASVIYGPQKGASRNQIQVYDKALNYFGSLIESFCNKKMKKTPGAGASGGLGFALLAIGAKLVSGAKLLAESMNLEAVIKQSDLVITGEGQSDEQTLYGKAPGHIASLANKYHVPVVLISGSLQGDLKHLNKDFIGCFSIINQPISLEKSMEQAYLLLYQQTRQVIRFMGAILKGKSVNNNI